MKKTITYMDMEQAISRMSDYPVDGTQAIYKALSDLGLNPAGLDTSELQDEILGWWKEMRPGTSEINDSYRLRVYTELLYLILNKTIGGKK